MSLKSLLESKGLTSVSGKTYPGTYALADSGSFNTDQLVNRDSATWKKAEHIILKECDSILPSTLLSQWRRLTFDGKHPQFLYRPLGDGTYEKYDAKGVKLAVGKLDDLIEQLKDEEQAGAKLDLLTIALKVFQKGRGEWKGEDGWETFDAWAKAAREAFATVDESWLAKSEFNYADFMRKFAISQTVANTTFAKHTHDEQFAVLKFLREEREHPHAVEWHLDKANRLTVDGKDVSGMSPTSVCFFMMKLHPATFAAYSKMTYASCAAVGLYAKPIPETCENMTPTEYARCRAMQDRILERMHGLGIGRTADDSSDADYITANEFVWFVSKYQKEIENEVMKMKLKTPTHEIKAGKMTLKDVLAKSDTDGAHNDLMTRLVAALLTKPFAILSGVSGTGKSRMVRKLAYMTCNSQELQPDATEKPIGNFCMVQVKPNWHDSSDLLGYRSAISDGKYVSTDFVRFVLKAHAFPETPFFVCLDEMNLAPVEHYFAEFLSASESGRGKGKDYVTDPIVNPGDFAHDVANLDPQEYAISDERRKMIEKIGLYLPSNLFVVGTVNMDDTTGGFSRKVLDRAMTIEMNEVKFAELKKNSDLEIDELLLSQEEIAKFLEKREVEENDLDDDFAGRLEEIRKDLEPTPLAFAYRFARECLLYRKALAALFPEEMGWKDDAPEKEKEEKRKVQSDFALDHLFLMKILPRLVGSTESCGEFLTKLKTMLDGFGEKHRLSAEKLGKMIDAAKMNGEYLSYWL